MMISPDEGRGSRIKTNVIDYRPLTAPLMSPRTFSRPSSPPITTTLPSPPANRDRDSGPFKSPLEKAEMDMEKLFKNLPGFLLVDQSDFNNNNNDFKKDVNGNLISSGHTINRISSGQSSSRISSGHTSSRISSGHTSSRISSGHTSSRISSGHTSSRNSSCQNSGRIPKNRTNNNYNSPSKNPRTTNFSSGLTVMRPLSRGSSCSISAHSTPMNSSRREENSMDLHTKRMTTVGKLLLNCTTKNSSYDKKPPAPTKKCPGRSSTSGSPPTIVPPKTAPGSINFPAEVDKNSTNSNNKSTTSSGGGKIVGQNQKRICQKTTTKRCATSEDDEKENPPQQQQRKEIFLKHVFVVNGSVVTFKSFGYENFTNWFGDETMLSKEKRTADFFHRELDVWGFTNREITMKLFCGNKLMVEANRPVRGKLPAKKFKETIILPNHLPVESLIVCRNRSGRLILEELPRVVVPMNNGTTT